MQAHRNRLVSIAVATLLSAAVVTGAYSQQRRPIKLDERGEPVPETATSFDCKKVTSRVEKLICQNRILASEDGDLGESYWFLKRMLGPVEQASVIRSQREWIARRNKCGDYRCIEAAYEERLNELRKLSAARTKYLSRNVSRLGQCEVTKIDWIGTRLELAEGEPPDGTAVTFKNGIYQVSYDRVRAILSSNVGDPARVCLISIPRDCPPGDERGRVYRVTNLRTGRNWELPDAEHERGGA